MKFNPLTKDVFTNQGQLIKKLHCPYKMSWENLKTNTGNTQSRLCSICEHDIIETSTLNDQELYDLLQLKPDTCLKIDLNQNNLNIIINEHF